MKKWIPLVLTCAAILPQRAEAFAFACRGVVTFINGDTQGEFALGDTIEGEWNFDGPFHGYGTGQQIINLSWGYVKEWTSDVRALASIEGPTAQWDVAGDYQPLLPTMTPSSRFTTCGGSLGDRISLYAQSQTGRNVEMHLDFPIGSTWFADGIHPLDFSAAVSGSGSFNNGFAGGGYFVAFQLTEFRNIPEPAPAALGGLLAVLVCGRRRPRRGDGENAQVLR